VNVIAPLGGRGFDLEDVRWIVFGLTASPDSIGLAGGAAGGGGGGGGGGAGEKNTETRPRPGAPTAIVLPYLAVAVLAGLLVTHSFVISPAVLSQPARSLAARERCARRL
jgi:hypothetical protein